MRNDNAANNGEALIDFGFGLVHNKPEFTKSMGNTVGRLSEVEKAYLAGFLDGDGSIMLQIHRREAGLEKFRVKTVVCFYQDKRHIDKLEQFRSVLGFGYVYTRSDGISELRIEGFQKVLEILQQLYPYLRFKRKQGEIMLDLIPNMQKKEISLNQISEWIKKVRDLNYFSAQRTTLEDVPVTTDI